MNIVITIILTVQLLAAVAMIGVIPWCSAGKGADMGAAFGSGGCGSLFGASGSANFLSRAPPPCRRPRVFVSTLGIGILRQLAPCQFRFGPGRPAVAGPGRCARGRNCTCDPCIGRGTDRRNGLLFWTSPLKREPAGDC